jgi:hypothetical protein
MRAIGIGMVFDNKDNRIFQIKYRQGGIRASANREEIYRAKQIGEWTSRRGGL